MSEENLEDLITRVEKLQEDAQNVKISEEDKLPFDLLMEELDLLMDIHICNIELKTDLKKIYSEIMSQLSGKPQQIQELGLKHITELSEADKLVSKSDDGLKKDLENCLKKIELIISKYTK